MLDGEPVIHRKGLIRSKFDVPVSEIQEVFPTFVMLESQIHLNKRAPLGSLGFADEMYPGFRRSAVGLASVTGDAGTNDVLPSRGTTPVAGDDVVQVQILAVENVTAILASVAISLEDVVPGEFDFLLGQAIENHQQDDARNANSERDGVDALRMGFLP